MAAASTAFRMKFACRCSSLTHAARTKYGNIGTPRIRIDVSLDESPPGQYSIVVPVTVQVTLYGECRMEA